MADLAHQRLRNLPAEAGLMVLMRPRLTLAIGVLALLGFGAVPAQADAAYYAMQRTANQNPDWPPMYAKITVKGRWIVDYKIRLNTTCSSGRGYVIFEEFKPIRIDRRGRFSFVSREPPGSSNTYSEGLKGRITPRRIYGFAQFRYSVPEICYSGREWRDPWVRFVAKRKRRP